MIYWIDIMFAVSIGVSALLGVVVFIEWNIYRAFEYKRFKQHLQNIEEIQKEKGEQK